MRDTDICPDMEKCRAHVAQIAPWDHKLYRQVRREFAARVRRAGGLTGRVDKLRAMRAGRQGGACERSRCCCNERRPCFNITRRDHHYRTPPGCVPGSVALQRLVASDMPLGWCCVHES